MDLRLEPITSKDFHQVKLLQPPTWGDILPVIQFYVTSEFCFPKKCVVNDKIVGIGTAIVHGASAWLAHIIVDEEQRNKGIGKFITQGLVESLRGTPCETISLIATQLGEPVYKKIGFEKEMDYVYMKNGRTTLVDSSPIMPYKEQYKNELLALDEIVSGETRSRLLKPHLSKSYVIAQGSHLQGFYLPTLGDGLIIAQSPEAGIELMKFKYIASAIAAVPVENKTALEFLISQGYEEYARGSRMWYGKKLAWQPDKVFSRIGGNLG